MEEFIFAYINRDGEREEKKIEADDKMEAWDIFNAHAPKNRGLVMSVTCDGAYVYMLD